MSRLVQAIAVLVLLAAPVALVALYLAHPPADQILAGMKAAYQQALFYRAHTTVDLSISAQPGSYDLAYARPNKLKLSFRNIAGGETIICDGLSLYRYRPDRQEYTIEPAPRELEGILPGEQPIIVLGLLAGTLQLPEGAQYVGRERIGGVLTYGIRLSGESDDPTRLTCWVGADDHLIRRAEMAQPVGTDVLTYTLTNEDISLAPLPNEFFRFDPPAGARPVARFPDEPEPLPAPPEGVTRP